MKNEAIGKIRLHLITLLLVTNLKSCTHDNIISYTAKTNQIALYLDGAISQMYCPEKNMLQDDQPFGVIMAIVAPN